MPDSDEMYTMADGEAGDVPIIEELLGDVDDSNAVADGRAPPQDIVDSRGNVITDPHGLLPDDYEGRDVAEQVAHDLAHADTRSIEQQNAAVMQIYNRAQEMAYEKAAYLESLVDIFVQFKTVERELQALNPNPATWAQVHHALSALANDAQVYAANIQKIEREAFQFNAWLEDAKATADRPALATPAGKQQVIDDAVEVLPLYGINPNWLLAQWNMSTALRDHRSTIMLADIFRAFSCLLNNDAGGALAVVQRFRGAARSRPRTENREKMPHVAESIADREDRQQWAVDNIENILGAA